MRGHVGKVSGSKGSSIGKQASHLSNMATPISHVLGEHWSQVRIQTFGMQQAPDTPF